MRHDVKSVKFRSCDLRRSPILRYGLAITRIAITSYGNLSHRPFTIDGTHCTFADSWPQSGRYRTQFANDRWRASQMLGYRIPWHKYGRWSCAGEVECVTSKGTHYLMRHSNGGVRTVGFGLVIFSFALLSAGFQIPRQSAGDVIAEGTG